MNELTVEQERAAKELCRTLGIGMVEASARVRSEANTQSDHADDDTTTLDE